MREEWDGWEGRDEEIDRWDEIRSEEEKGKDRLEEQKIEEREGEKSIVYNMYMNNNIVMYNTSIIYKI